MALAVGNTSSGSFTTAANPTLGLINNTNGVNTLLITYNSNGAFAKTLTISDPHGVIWHCRKRTQFQSAYTGAGSTANANFITQELWWSNDPTSNNRTVTLTVLNNSSVVQAEWLYACITGSTTPSAPWDTSGSLPAVQTFGNASSTAAISQSVTTAQNNSMILAMVSEQTSSLSGATVASTGTGMTAVDNVQDGTSPNIFHIFQEEKILATAGTTTVACTTSKQSFVFIVDALSGTSTGTAAGETEVLQLLAPSSSSGQGGTGTTYTVSYTVPANTLVIFYAQTYGFSGLNYCEITGITDTGGLTWKRRNKRKFLNNYGGTGSNGSEVFLNQEYWWAYTSAAQTSQTITVTVTGATNQGLAPDYALIAIGGVNNTSAPWDTGTTGEAHFSNVSTFNGPASATYTTAQANSMVLAFLQQFGSSGHGLNTLSTGYTSIANISRGTSPNFIGLLAEESIQATAGAGTVTFGGSTLPEWGLLIDALSGTATGSSTDLGAGGETGTIATNLTKISQSASGTEIFTGTITTHLTKANISAAGWTTVSGTVATNLTKVSQTAQGSSGVVDGTITTNLTKVSQLLSNAQVIYTGTITTHLTKASFAASGWTTVFGTATTNLSGVSMVATDIEEFIGTITTNLQGISGVAIAALEQFVGTITTHLGPVSQNLIAEEDIIGTIHTRLGPESGGAIGNVVQALEIIQGPIVMQLGPINYSLLGAQLGAAGAGPWYSYRYLDS